jgi:nucleoside-diphosphate-sugar epimerase
MSQPTAILTGATGFIGSHLTRRLVSEGWDVHLIVRPTSRLTSLDGVSDGVTIHRHDGSTQGMSDIMGAVRPDIVFHLASLFLAQHRPEDIEPLIQANVLFGTQLVDAMVVHGVHRLVNTGTSWQHFQNAEYSPVCLYAATKQAFEAILQFYVEASSLRVVTLKLFDTYGPRDPRAKLFALLRKAAQGQVPLAMSPGEQSIDLVYIDDVVEAFVMAADRLLRDEVRQLEEYAVSSGKPIRLQDLVETYGRVTGRTVPVEWGRLPYRPREVMIPWNRGQGLPGWHPKIGLEEGIGRMGDQER